MPPSNLNKKIANAKLGEFNNWTPSLHSDKAESKENLNAREQISKAMVVIHSKLASPEKEAHKSPAKNRISPNLMNIFPNLLNNNSTDDPKFNNLVGETYINNREIVTTCYVCNKKVRKSCKYKHLLFGSLNCLDCGKEMKDCKSFASIMRKAEYYKNCSHINLGWTNCPVSDLKYLIEQSNVSSKSKDTLLNEYLVNLKHLENRYPWSLAIAACWKYLLSREDEINDQHDKPVSKKRYKTTREAEKNGEQIKLPRNGFYLILQEPTEECPNCYEPLDIKRIVFNLSNELVFTTCHECSLSIYFVLNPPDGSQPKIRILQDNLEY